ncbi:MAG: ABC transporter substrate-binding protein [Chloroflexi bacterium]|nr:ABC transporter substrate-binding protein [Chloroflexota bacterium]
METSAPTPVRGIGRSQRKAQIIGPISGWPRQVADVAGIVTIPNKPTRIHTLSVGFDEITFRLVEPSRVIAVGRVTADPQISNVADQARQIPNQVGRNAEQIVALQPDLVVASPFASVDLLEHLRSAGIPLVVADLVSSVDSHEENIRFLAYLYGEEAKGDELIQEVRERLERLQQFVARQPIHPRVLLLNGPTAAGSGTNEDGILRLAGAINAAAEVGLVGNREISLEVIPEMDPDIIVLTEADPALPSASSNALLQHPGLADLRAMRDQRIVRIKASLVNTLSHWNIAGAEALARAFYPEAL